MMMLAFMYGDNPRSIILNLSNPQPINELKSRRPECPPIFSFNDSSASEFTQGSGITAKKLYISIRRSVIMIFFLRLGLLSIRLMFFIYAYLIASI